MQRGPAGDARRPGPRLAVGEQAAHRELVQDGAQLHRVHRLGLVEMVRELAHPLVHLEHVVKQLRRR